MWLCASTQLQVFAPFWRNERIFPQNSPRETQQLETDQRQPMTLTTPGAWKPVGGLLFLPHDQWGLTV